MYPCSSDFNKLYNKCIKQIKRNKNIIICHEFDYDTGVDVVVKLRENGYNAKIPWGATVMHIRIDNIIHDNKSYIPHSSF